MERQAGILKRATTTITTEASTPVSAASPL
jgi:hypothetical protein